MGRLIEGAWHTAEELQRLDDEVLEAEPDSFRSWIDPGDASPGRFHLYISRACPWEHRTTLVCLLKGLEGVVSMDVVDPVRVDEGWEFTPEQDGCTPDTVDGADYLSEVYVEADTNYTGRVTVPVRYDTETGSIVNDESTVTQTCDLEHVKAHYYRSHRDINPTGFVPVGPQVDWTAPHDRDGLGGFLPNSLHPERVGTSRR